jgi:hypothetical protein
MKKPAEKQEGECFVVGFLLRLPFDPEYGDRTFLRNVGGLLPDYTASHHR